MLHGFEHMRREGTEVMPLAEKSLNDEDWSRIELAVKAHEDPLRCEALVAEDYQQFFSRIVSLAPAPIGLGEAL